LRHGVEVPIWSKWQENRETGKSVSMKISINPDTNEFNVLPYRTQTALSNIIMTMYYDMQCSLRTKKFLEAEHAGQEDASRDEQLV